MFKKFIYTFILFIIFIIILILNINTLEKKLPDQIKKFIPWHIVNYYYSIQNISNALKNYNYLYNAKFLPDSHFQQYDLKKYEIFNEGKQIKDKKIFIEIIFDKIFLATHSGDFYYQNIEDGFYFDKNFREISFSFNHEINEFEILDTLIDEGHLYVSLKYIDKINNCEKFFIFKSIIDINKLNFHKIFEDKNCAKNMIAGGRMQILNDSEDELLLFSLADVANDEINDDPQTGKNFFGKINYLNLGNQEYGIYSYGHRNPQGLLVYKNKILSTEHGPRGGDELNLIKKNHNYGWPISSYGNAYFKNEINYTKNHKNYNFVEPVFSFIKAIGISEIIAIPENYFHNNDFQNVFMISSLFGRSVYLTKLSDDLERVIFMEKIFINQRIRDIKYNKKDNIVILGLENPTQIGILR